MREPLGHRTDRVVAFMSIAERAKQVFTTGEVARICKVAPRTVAKWFDSGQLRGYRIPGSKDRRIPINYLLRFMRAHDIPFNGLETGQVRVLLLDDEHEFALLLRDALTRGGSHQVEIAACAYEAGLLTEQFRPHVIVADVSLAGVQPRRFCQLFRTNQDLSGIRLIAIGGALTPGQGHALLQDGFDAFLPKPFEVRQLIKLIDELSSILE